MSVELYDNLSESYDLMISWKRRLRRERPFVTSVFREFGVRRILDTAAGTGMHAIAFCDWGYHVVAADISGSMIAKARENAGTRKIRFVQAGFTDEEAVDGMFDAITCLGNSLPHVLSDDELERSLSSMYRLLLPGGVLIIHNNNYDGILAKRERFMPLAQARRDGSDYLFLRFFDFQDGLLTFNVVTLWKRSGQWHMTTDSTTHRALTRDLLVGKLSDVGFQDIRTFGAFSGDAFDELESDNLIVVAQRPHTIVSNPPGEPVAAIDRIPICENGEPLVNIAQAIPGVVVRDEGAWARLTVVEMLRRAKESLPQGYTFFVKCGFRSLDRQRTIYERYLKQVAERNPDWPPSQVRREVNKFLAPPDAKHPPGHTTGGAIDLTVVGPDGKELDMTSTIKDVENVSLTFPTYSKLITPHAAKNRQLLVDTMLGVGFSNYPGEWWHYSYGDSAWALRVGASFAVYGAAPAPADQP